MPPNYRARARGLLQSARALLDSDDEKDLLLACLYLRMCMEGVTYERAQPFADDLGPDAMKTWQPRRLMERMLEVDPQADSTSDISFAKNGPDAEPSEPMRYLGTDNVLNLATLKKHYDALGSFLHMPTQKQIEAGKEPNREKIFARCEVIYTALKVVLDSSLWNFNMTQKGTLDCLNCGKEISRRIASDAAVRSVKCWNCGVTYDMKSMDNNQVNIEPRQIGVECPNDGCNTMTWLWEKDAHAGTSWSCRDCGTNLQLALGVAILPPKEP